MYNLNYFNYISNNKLYKKDVLNKDYININGGANDNDNFDNDIEDTNNQNNITKTLITDSSRLILYTIKKGTILYHGSKSVETFNPFNIKLDDNTLAGYFTTNKQFSADYINRCSNYPNEQGYIHKFLVKRDITRILIISKYEKKSNWNVKNIEDMFCSSNKYSEKLDGIGFFYLSNTYNNFNDDTKIDDNNDDNSFNENKYDIELALCDPNNFLEYISTQRCLAIRKISIPYQFTQQ